MAHEIKSLTERQQTLIVNNVVRACADIEKLNRTGYNFLYLASGFIAHYSINGFKGYYTNFNDLRQDILDNIKANMWNNFRPGDQYYDYYKSRANVYARIVDAIE